MLQDIVYAIRNLRRSPLLTLVALVSLALGIGANSAVFTIADQVLLRPIPVKHARELVAFTSPGPQSGSVWGQNRFSYPMYRDFRDHNSVFEGVAARFPTDLNLSYNNRSERIRAELVSGTWFDTLGLTPALGRGLSASDDRLPGAHPVVVLTYDYWKSRFSGNAGILNQTVLLNGYPMTVVGVVAPGYHGFDPGARVDALVPTMMKAQMTPTWDGLNDRRFIWLQLVGRLRPGVSQRRAQASLEPYYHGLLIMEMQTMKFRTERSREGFASKPLIFVPGGKGVSDLREQFTDPLLILLGIVGLLLLIACANVANLLLARAAGRQKEIAVRLAVGASRFLLVRQLIAESLVLSLLGGAVGILFAWWTGSALLGLLANSADVPLTSVPDLRVFAFTFGLSLLTGVLFGLVPAWQATSPKLALTLKDQAANISAGGNPPSAIPFARRPRSSTRDAARYRLRHPQFAAKPAVHARRPGFAGAGHWSQQRGVHDRRPGVAAPDPGEALARVGGFHQPGSAERERLGPEPLLLSDVPGFPRSQQRLRRRGGALPHRSQP